jgi:hypothetical protein
MKSMRLSEETYFRYASRCKCGLRTVPWGNPCYFCKQPFVYSEKPFLWRIYFGGHQISCLHARDEKAAKKLYSFKYGRINPLKLFIKK